MHQLNTNSRVYTIRRNRWQVLKQKTKRKLKFRRKLIGLRISLYLITSLLCIWQVLICLERYFREPISTTVERKNNIENYIHPKIIVCPYGIAIFDNLLGKMVTECMNDQSCSDYQTHRFSKRSVVEMWITDEVSENSSSRHYCLQQSSVNCTTSMRKSEQIDTVHGRCYLFANDNVYKYVSSDLIQFVVHFLQVEVKEDFEAKFFFSPISTFYKYNTDYKKLEDFATYYVHYQMVEVYNVNSNNNPCWTEENVINCMNSCFDNLLNKTNLTCTLPFYESDLNYCQTIDEVENFKTEITNAYLHQNKCKCKRACNTTTYYSMQIDKSSVKRDKNAIYFSIAIPKIITSELFSYPLSSLTADVLSNVGFFLGFTMISAFDVFVYGLYAIKQTFKKWRVNSSMYYVAD